MDSISVSGSVTNGTGPELSFETGKLAAQAGGAVTARIGDTSVLVTATAAKEVRDGIDFFPLTVDVEARMYAAGKIPGGFPRREGRASDKATLTCRLIDRPLRPSFPDGYRNETQIVVTVLSADQENPYDVLAINAASAALMVSDIPFNGPIGAVRLAYTPEGEWVPHPTFEVGQESSLEIVVAGRQLDNGEVAVMMVEAGGTENTWENVMKGAPKVDEKALADALEQSGAYIKEAIALQMKLVEANGGQKPYMEFEAQVDYTDEQFAAVMSTCETKLVDIMSIADKGERGTAEKALRDEALTPVLAAVADEDKSLVGKQLKAAFKAATKKVVRRRVVDDNIRIDGRGPSDLRKISAEVGYVPRVHGSGLFQRGETQVLNILTLGMKKMDQMLDGIDPVDKKRYMHHYNFPPFSVGETGFMRGPKRREIGHGLLAERALVPVIPNIEEWPYALRLVSEVLASNGSTSMASVCGSSLSLMDAGVPIKAPVAGIAMGLIHVDGKYTTLTDILGAEDAFGDMDFKVAGTSEFITALQLDTKIEGIPSDVLAQALQQAREARMEILRVMEEAIQGPREEVRDGAPQIISFEIPIDKIGEVIGPKGKVINSISDETGADISVDDDGVVGTVSVCASDRAVVDEAERQIKLILDPPTAEIGVEYDGRVVNITKFGAFVSILPGRDGLLHISKIGQGERIDRVEDVLELGQEVKVVVEDVDPNGKISLKIAGDETEYENKSSSSKDDRGSKGRNDRKDASAPRSNDRPRNDRPRNDNKNDSKDESSGSDKITMSFDDDFIEEFGDLGPEVQGRGRGRQGGRSKDRQGNKD